VNSGYPIPAGLPEPAKPKPAVFVQGEEHKHDGVACEEWQTCSRTSDDQKAYLDAYVVIVQHGRGSPQARAAYNNLDGHPWAQLLLRQALGMKESK
jgi:hypothetical protein